jgi:hypothetical protein
LGAIIEGVEAAGCGRGAGPGESCQKGLSTHCDCNLRPTGAVEVEWLRAVAALTEQSRQFFASCGECAWPLNVWTIRRPFYAHWKRVACPWLLWLQESSPARLRGSVCAALFAPATLARFFFRRDRQHFATILTLNCRVLASGGDSAYCAHWTCDPAASLCQWRDNC